MSTQGRPTVPGPERSSDRAQAGSAGSKIGSAAGGSPRFGPVFLGLAFLGLAGLMLAMPYLVGPGDAFRSTLRMLPVVILGFLWVDARLARPGAGIGQLGLRAPGSTAWALGALVVTVPARHVFAFASADALWAAGFLLVLAKAIVERLPALRRGLGHGIGSRGGQVSRGPDLAFFLLPLVVYLAVQPWALEHRQPDGDEPYYLLLTHSLAYDGDIDLANNYQANDASLFLDRQLVPQLGDPRGPQGQVYSRHTGLLPTLLAPAYRLAGRSGASAVMALMAALLAWWTLRLARRTWPEHASGALLAWACLAFSPPLILYAHQVWVEVPAALLTVVGFDAAFALCGALSDRQSDKEERGGGLESTASAGSSSPDSQLAPSAVVGRWGLVLAACLILLPALKLRLALVAVPLLVLALWLCRRHGRPVLLWIGGIPAMLALLLLGYNHWRFGNPARMYGQAELGQYQTSIFDYLRGAFGLLYDSAFGLFVHAPIWVLLLPASVLLWRYRKGRLLLALGVMVPYLVALAPRLEWYGGWSPPFRYPLVFLPLLAWILVPLLELRPTGTRWLCWLLAPWTAVLCCVWLVVPGWTYSLADGGSHLLHLSSELLGADTVRLFPSTVRFRLATVLWILASLLTIPLALVGARRVTEGSADGSVRAWRRSSGLGWVSSRHLGSVATVCLLLLLAAVPLAAHRLPTRIVQFEDAWVSKVGGHLEPERWTLQRPKYRGGWLLTSGARAAARVVPGGAKVELRIHARRLGKGPKTLLLTAGESALVEVDLASGRSGEGGWQELQVGPFEWPAGEPLGVRIPEVFRRQDVGIVVDRIELDWR